MINIGFALLGLYIGFSISSFSRELETHDPPNGRRVCALFSAVLEYFSLVYLMWTVAEAVLLLWAYLKAQEMRVPGKVLVFTSLVCWGKQLIIAKATVVVRKPWNIHSRAGEM